MNNNLILAINPGSTSTKIAVYNGTELLIEKNIKHTTEELSQFDDMIGQYGFRKNLIIKELEINSINFDDIKIIIGRGGLLKPVESGIYNINEKMKEDLVQGAASSKHASNLGGLLADDFATQIPGAKAYIADPPVVDEMEILARITGHPKFKRKSLFHALNQKAIARQHAEFISTDYEKLNLIVAHLGGGISVGAHKKGRIMDVNNALDGEGPLSPERSGSLPIGDVVKLCFSGEYTFDEVKKMLVGHGGMSAHLGTNNTIEIEKKALNGNNEYKLILDAMIYQIAKYIGSMYSVLFCDVDAILITGGMAHSKYITEEISRRVKKMADVFVYPGENEMEALAFNGRMLLNGNIAVQEY
jgi:butyrate kinase